MLSSVVGLMPPAPAEGRKVDVGILGAEAEAAELALIDPPPETGIDLVFRLDIGRAGTTGAVHGDADARLRVGTAQAQRSRRRPVKVLACCASWPS